MNTLKRIHFAVAALVAASITHADTITFSAAAGDRAASAIFAASGGQLIVTLTNTSTFDANDPAHLLTGVFFTLGGDPTLTRISALLAAGSTVAYDDSQPAGGVVGGEWAYKNHLGGAPGGANEGISSSGLGLFGKSDRFPGVNLAGPVNIGGPDYGILPAGWVATDDNGGLTGSGGLIWNSVVFTLGNWSGTLDVTNVSFQYGTDLTEPNIRVPDNGSALLLLGAGLLGLAAWLRQNRA